MDICCAAPWRHTTRKDAGRVNKNGGSPTDSGHRAHRRLYHRSRPRTADSHPHWRARRAAPDRLRPRTNRLGRPAGRSLSGLRGPGATVTRVRPRPGSAVVAPFRCRRAPVRRPSLHPCPGKPTPTRARPPPIPARPFSDGDLIPVRLRPSPSAPARRSPCHTPPGDATLRPAPAARGVALPIPYPSLQPPVRLDFLSLPAP